jgi:hypothetical protein
VTILLLYNGKSLMRNFGESVNWRMSYGYLTKDEKGEVVKALALNFVSIK